MPGQAATNNGLSAKSVRRRIDQHIYAKGRRISDDELAPVHLEPNAFHGEWNYTIHPTGAL